MRPPDTNSAPAKVNPLWRKLQAVRGDLHTLVAESPSASITRWHKTALFALELATHGAREMAKNQASQMAAALTYRTLFSLVPIAVCGLLVVNAFGGFDQLGGNLQQRLHAYFNVGAFAEAPLGINTEQSGDEFRLFGPRPLEPTAEDTRFTVPFAEPGQGLAIDAYLDPSALTSDPGLDALVGEDLASTTAPDALASNEELEAQLDNLLDDVGQRMGSVSFGSIGAVGVVLLVWAAVAMLVSLESSFNRVCNAQQGRPWTMRILIYWGVISLGPLLLAIGFVTAERLLAAGRELPVLGAMVVLLTPLSSLATTWLLFMVLYKLVPNTRIGLRPALIGAFIAAVAWETSKWAFRLYVATAVGTSALYGALGLVPLFLLWVYLTWLIILFGLQITHTLHTFPDQRSRARLELASLREKPYDRGRLLEVVAGIAHGFGQGRAPDIDDLVQALGLSPATVAVVVQDLLSAGIIHRVHGSDGEPAGLALAKPPDQIQIDDVLRLAVTQPVMGSPGEAIVGQLNAQQQSTFAQQTLADLS